MIANFANQLWQSTLFALVAASLGIMLRNNRASVRYGLWFAASFKFLVPFSILISLGSHLKWVPIVNAINTPISQVVSPGIALPASAVTPFLTGATQTSVDWIRLSLFGLWVCGAGAIALTRLRGWRRIRAIVRRSTPLTIPGMAGRCFQTGIQIRFSTTLLEPSVVGLWRSVLLLPAGVEGCLPPAQLDAVLAHELCHARRRDNLTAAIHMLVEALFWFHPLVWWIGARLVDERERACDEHVLQVFREPRAYAEGILHVCKLYVESPLKCVSAVTGSTNIKKRIEDIMNDRVGRKLSLARKAALTVAAMLAIVMPIGIGMTTAPLQAQTAGAICAETDPVIRLELQSADNKILSFDGATSDRPVEVIAQELIDRYPDDFIVHIRYQQWIRGAVGPTALIEPYKSLFAAHPGNPMFTILYAQALRGVDVPQAINLLKNVSSSPLDPWVHLTLAELYSSAHPTDLPETRAHLDAWFGACPSTPNWNALLTLLQYGSSATAAKEAAALRAELEGETDPHLLLSWQFIWDLELKARPVDEHEVLRQQIALDVAQLESIPAPNDYRWPQLLAFGHKLASDPEVR